MDLGALATSIIEELRRSQPEREVEFVTQEGVMASADPNLVAEALENLIGNAWKFTARKPRPRIEVGSIDRQGEGRTYFMRDDGACFDEAYAGKLFGAFQRLRAPKELEGTGIGLATVQRIIHRHGGRVWAEGEVGRGATFYFTLGSGHRRGSSPPSRKAGTS